MSDNQFSQLDTLAFTKAMKNDNNLSTIRKDDKILSTTLSFPKGVSVDESKLNAFLIAKSKTMKKTPKTQKNIQTAVQIREAAIREIDES